MAFKEIEPYLRYEANRCRRKRWVNPREGMDEIFLILANVPQDTTGPVSVVPPDGNPVAFDPIDEPILPPLDLDFPEDGVPEPDVDADPETGHTSTTTTQWHRAIFPGKVISQVGTSANYNIDIYPEGQLGSARSITARLTDPDLAGDIELNIWLYVYRAIQYVIREDTFPGGSQTQIDTSTQEYLFNAPATTGGKVARVTSTISAREGTTPGEGAAILYAVDSDSGDLEPVGEAVTVYNMVTSEVTAGSDKFIQVKRIDGSWWVDVEDCSAESD